ncbi:collagen alpha-1(XVI) chain, partial [Bombina bombina]
MWLLWTCVLWLLRCIVFSNGGILHHTGDLCPSLEHEGLIAGDGSINTTGFNLIRRFSLQKTSLVKKIRNPKGPMIMRLGGARLVQPTAQLFPYGIPDEFTLVITLLLKKQTTDEDWYLFQINDLQGYPQ